MELEEAIKKLKKPKNIDLITLIRQFKREGIENFVVTRPDIIQTVLTHITRQEKMIDEIKSKLEEHIQHCKQEARGSLHNEICHISLKFDETLLNIIEKKAEENL